MPWLSWSPFCRLAKERPSLTVFRRREPQLSGLEGLEPLQFPLCDHPWARNDKQNGLWHSPCIQLPLVVTAVRGGLWQGVLQREDGSQAAHTASCSQPCLCV